MALLPFYLALARYVDGFSTPSANKRLLTLSLPSHYHDTSLLHKDSPHLISSHLASPHLTPHHDNLSRLILPHASSSVSSQPTKLRKTKNFFPSRIPGNTCKEPCGCTRREIFLQQTHGEKAKRLEQSNRCQTFFSQYFLFPHLRPLKNHHGC